MDQDVLDRYTFGHFMFGCISRVAVFRGNRVLSLTFSNLIHLFSELNELHVNELTGEKINSPGNNLADIYAFLLGSVIVDRLMVLLPSGKIRSWLNYSKSLQIFSLIIGTIGLINELIIEWFPNMPYIGKYKKEFKGRPFYIITYLTVFVCLWLSYYLWVRYQY